MKRYNKISEDRSLIHDYSFVIKNQNQNTIELRFFHQAAKEELLSTRDYYNDLNFGLGKSFIIEIEKTVAIIARNPLAYPISKKIYAKQ